MTLGRRKLQNFKDNANHGEASNENPKTRSPFGSITEKYKSRSPFGSRVKRYRSKSNPTILRKSDIKTVIQPIKSGRDLVIDRHAISGQKVKEIVKGLRRGISAHKLPYHKTKEYNYTV